MTFAFCVRVAAQRTPVVERTVALLSREITARSGMPVKEIDDGAANLILDIQAGIGSEGFSIADGPQGAVALTGNDERGLLYGIGRFLRDADCAPGSFRPGGWRGSSVPSKPVRGVYFATHFFNFYHTAPLAEIERYVEDLALWGCNAISVWFDMHQFAGIHDPAAQGMIERLRAILMAARRLGLGTSIGALGNEAYADSPAELRADPNTGRAHYGVELCPSKPGAPELVLRWIEEKIEAFADIGIDYLWAWPYDQGGCACERCRPWGANGYLRMAREISRIFKRRVPDGKFVVSTWLFDYGKPQGEWEGFSKALAADHGWLDYVLADTHDAGIPDYPLRHGAPGGLPLLNFPEISMFEMLPWGGFGANPMPDKLQRMMDRAAPVIAGGFMYSEGIYEDLNKVAVLQLYWDPARRAGDIVREYAAWEFGRDVADDVTQAVAIMERNHGMDTLWISGSHRVGAYGFPVTLKDKSPYEFRYQILNECAGTDECEAFVKRADARLPEARRSAWRWRILYIRAALDAALAREGLSPSPVLDPYFEELEARYHVEPGTVPFLIPPSRRMLSRMVRAKE